ncbi:MAG TPA: hypothetical protein VGH27_04440 [Streptosporangiaceae bacterium]
MSWRKPKGSAPDTYVERYRLSGQAVLGLAVILLLFGFSFLWNSPLIFLPIGVILAALVAHGSGIIDLARRTIAFRADQAGITLGRVPDRLSVRRGSALFIPWSDVQRIILYPAYQPRPGGRAAVQCVGIQRRPGAEPLLWGNEQALNCPVPGVATWATRMIVGWQLDRDRLAAATASLAPAIPILDTATTATATDTTTTTTAATTADPAPIADGQD